MCASLNAPLNAEPRWPEVPNATRCAVSDGSGRTWSYARRSAATSTSSDGRAGWPARALWLNGGLVRWATGRLSRITIPARASVAHRDAVFAPNRENVAVSRERVGRRQDGAGAAAGSDAERVAQPLGTVEGRTEPEPQPIRASLPDRVRELRARDRRRHEGDRCGPWRPGRDGRSRRVVLEPVHEDALASLAPGHRRRDEVGRRTRKARGEHPSRGLRVRERVAGRERG